MDEAFIEMEQLLPNVLNTMFEIGKLDSYLKFNRLIHEGKLPMNNICFLLFIDLVEWFSVKTTSNMKYQTETLQFWQMGYRLFHGKFLRFMSGLRNYGQVVSNEAERGELDPLESKINFAVPSQKNLYRNKDNHLPVYPGICRDHIQVLSEKMFDVPLKLCVDGKKISRGKGKTMGDIDCWGHEGQPTLNDKKLAYNQQIKDVKKIQAKLDSLSEKDSCTLQNVQSPMKEELLHDLKKEITCLAENNKLLREKFFSLERLETKFKTLGGKDWMTSKFYPVICSVRVSRSSVKTLLEESIRLANKLAFYAATLNEKQHQYHVEDTVLMQQQSNYYPLRNDYESENTRYIKQRTEQWADIRSRAMVTGSTCNSALGLSKLKDQQAHFDQVVLKNEKPEISDDVKMKMSYGVEHEDDAVVTVCGKVLPAFYPNLYMFEDGCITISHNDVENFMVVSPDGSFREGLDGRVCMTYENKCKAPSSYSPYAYYEIPLYYIPQLLCEMNASECDKLLFTCWSEHSMTVFEVENDKDLWDKCWSELTSVYGSECKSRPKVFSESSKALKKEVKEFRETKTKLIAEFPSSRASRSVINNRVIQNEACPYFGPEATNRRTITVQSEQVQESLIGLRQWHDSCYENLRNVASEILVFMLTDLDRIYDMESNNAHVVAYALKGPSMKQDVFRKMMKDVIDVCEENGLKICVTSSDGQWHQYGVRDDDERPLTVHQLQRQLWGKLRSMDKAKLQSTIKKLCLFQSLDEVEFEKSPGHLIVLGHKRDRFIHMPLKKADTCTPTEENFDFVIDKDDVQNTEDSGTHKIGGQNEEDEFAEDEFFQFNGCVSGDFENQVGYETVDFIDRIVSNDSDNDMGQNSEMFATGGSNFMSTCTFLMDLVMPLTDAVAENNMTGLLCTQKESERPRTYSLDRADEDGNTNLMLQDGISGDSSSTLFGIASRVLNEPEDGDWHANIWATQTASGMTASDGNVKDNEHEVTLTGADGIYDIYPHGKRPAECLSDIYEKAPLMKSLDSSTFAVMLRDLQCDEKCSTIHDWNSHSVDDLKNMCESKEVMNKKLQKREVYVCAKSIEKVHNDIDLHVVSNWSKHRLLEVLFSERITNTNQSTKRQRKGGKTASLKEMCWNKLKYLSKDQLMILLAEYHWENEYSDWRKRSVVPFNIPVTDVHDGIEWFTQPRQDLDGNVRFHFTDACHLLTCLRTKLCTSGIDGLQRTAWEIAALSKSTQLNISIVAECVDKQDVALARRVFAEDVENVMTQNGYEAEAEFCRLIRRWYDAIEIDNFRLNPDKPFCMKTSRARVYPSHASLSTDAHEAVEQSGVFIRTAEKAKLISGITPRDHVFDSTARDHRKHKRLSGKISQPGVPAHDERGVRQYHRRDDSKIPAHRRLGFSDFPEV